MILKISPKERTQKKKRYIISFFISMVIYIILLLVLVLFGNFKVNEEKEIVIKVKLQDKLEEDLGRMNDKEIKKIVREQDKAKENLKKRLENSKKTLEEKLENKLAETDAERGISKNSNREVKRNIEKKDLFEEYLKSKDEESKKLEENFFDKNKSGDSEEAKNENLDKLKKELSMIDNALSNIDSQNEVEQDESNAGSKEINRGNIKWEGGKSRELLYKTRLDIPDKFKAMGLKTSLKLKFIVFENGHIMSVEVIMSTGYPELDQNIVNQFRNWKFRESIGEVDATGIIDIAINY